MPISAEGIRELMELGISGDQMLAVVAIFERDEERHASRHASRDGRDGKRTKAAIRSMNYRARKRDASQGSSRHASRSPSYTEEEKRKDSREVKEEKKSRKPRASLLPDDFQPKPSHFDAAKRHGCGEQFVFDKFEDMRIWARANGILKVDWDQTLHGFIRRDAQNRTKNGNGTGNSRTDRPTGQAPARVDPILAGMGRIAGRINERRVPAGPEREIPPGDDASGFLDLEPVRTQGN